MSWPRGAEGDEELEAFGRFCGALVLEQGGPMILEDFQRELLRDYFQGVRETLVLIPKKNGKTTLLAALSLFHLISHRDAECVIGAASRDQATILYDQAAGFVRRTPRLEARVVAKHGYRQIRRRHDTDAGRIRVLAADVDTADGVIPTLALVDELHRHKSADLYGVFRDGLGPRDGQMITISTAGATEQSALGQMRKAARDLGIQREGRYHHALAPNGSYALHEWALDDEDDVENLELVKLVNPASWQTRSELAQRRDSPSTLPWQWARFACGIWVGSEGWWIESEPWTLALAQEVQLEDGDQVALGFDGSRVADATALVACRAGDACLFPLGVWERPAGAKTWEVPAGAVDAAVADAFERYRVLRLYADPPLWHTEIESWRREFGSAVYDFPTNRQAMMHATERFRTDVVGGRVRHSGNPTLTRHVLNAQIREARGGYWLAKDGTTTANHIDAAVAAVLAYEALCDAVAAGELERRRRGVAFL